MSITRSLLMVCLLASHISAFTQPSISRPFRVYSQSEGLPGAGVYGICEDFDGALLIGTDNGLSMLAGGSITAHPYTKNIPSRIIDRVFSLGKDSLLLVGARPKQLYLVHNGKWEVFPLDGLFPSGSKFSQSKQDKVLTYRVRGEIIELDTAQMVLYRQPTDARNLFTYHHTFKEDSIFLSTSRGAYIQGKALTLLPGLTGISSLVESGDSLILFGQGQLFSYRSGLIKSVASLANLHQEVQHSLIDVSGNVWFSGKNHGLYMHKNGTVHDVSDWFGLRGKQVNFLYKDRFENIWVATEREGLICIFKSRFSNYSEADGLSSNQVGALVGWNGSLYIGTNKGLNRITVNGVLHGHSLAKSIGVCDGVVPAFSGYIHSLSVQNNWLVVSSNSEINPLSGSRCHSKNIYTYRRRVYTEINDTSIFGNWGRIYSSNSIFGDDEMEDYHIKIDKRFAKEFFIHAEDDHFYLGTDNGLFKTTPRLNEIQKVEIGVLGDLNTTFYDCSNRVNGELWFATSNGLLGRKGSADWQLLTQTDGLNSNDIKALSIDNDERLWIGTNKGLNMYHQGIVVSYSSRSGLISDDINDLFFDQNKGVLWIATDRGVSRLNINLIEPNITQSGKVKVTRVTVAGDTTNFSGVANFTHDRNNLEFDYQNTEIETAKDILYQYRLMPDDTLWRTTTQTKVRYAALGADDYSFQVRSRTSGKDWSPVTAKVFSVRPPFWKSMAFLVPFLVLFLLGTLAVSSHRIRIVKKREANRRKLQEQVSHLEQQALSLSMNPHFIFNSLNSIQAVFTDQNDQKASKFVADFARLIRLNMESSKSRVIALNDEVERLELYLALEKSRFKKELAYKINMAPSVWEMDLEIPNMVVQPLIENAIWHGILPSSKSGRIALDIECNENELNICVTDNGIGLTAAQQNRSKQHQSQGLSITRQRIEYISRANFLKLTELTDGSQVVGTQAHLRLILE